MRVLKIQGIWLERAGLWQTGQSTAAIGPRRPDSGDRNSAEKDSPITRVCCATKCFGMWCPKGKIHNRDADRRRPAARGGARMMTGCQHISVDVHTKHHAYSTGRAYDVGADALVGSILPLLPAFSAFANSSRMDAMRITLKALTLRYRRPHNSR